MADFKAILDATGQGESAKIGREVCTGLNCRAIATNEVRLQHYQGKISIVLDVYKAYGASLKDFSRQRGRK